MRIRLVPGQSSAGNFNLQVSMPPPCIDSGGGSGPSGNASVYLAACYQVLPTSDYQSFLFAIHNLPESATVEWSLSDEGGYIIGGPTASADHSILVATSSGTGGTVSATVNGVSAGSVAYEGTSASGCYGTSPP